MSDPDWLHSGWLFGEFFDPPGTLLHVPTYQGIDIYDVHSGTLQKRVGAQQSQNTTVYKASVSDDTGNTLLLMTQNGLDVISHVPPLAVRSESPLLNSASAGSTITLVGTHFLSGAKIIIGDTVVSAIVTDSHTLTFTLPVVVAGNSLVVANPDGASYKY
jgi:IPT/TIG domain